MSRYNNHMRSQFNTPNVRLDADTIKAAEPQRETLLGFDQLGISTKAWGLQCSGRKTNIQINADNMLSILPLITTSYMHQAFRQSILQSNIASPISTPMYNRDVLLTSYSSSCSYNIARQLINIQRVFWIDFCQSNLLHFLTGRLETTMSRPATRRCRMFHQSQRLTQFLLFFILTTFLVLFQNINNLNLKHSDSDQHKSMNECVNAPNFVLAIPGFQSQYTPLLCGPL